MDILKYAQSVEAAKEKKHYSTWDCLRSIVAEYMQNPSIFTENYLWKISYPVSFNGMGFALYYDGYIVCEVQQNTTTHWTVTSYRECDYVMHAGIVKYLIKILEKYHITVSNAAMYCC